jgi:hypothetical protein
MTHHTTSLQLEYVLLYGVQYIYRQAGRTHILFLINSSLVGQWV